MEQARLGVDQSPRQYYPGDRVLTEGERGSDIFILVRGELEVTRGRTRLGVLRGRGDVIGEIAALTDRPRSATVTALTESELLRVRVEFKTVSARNPEIVEKIDGAVRFRYEVARNKALLYTRRAAHSRRTVLHETLVKNEMARVGKRVTETQVRKAMRRALDDFLSLHGDVEDPRVLRKMADDYSVTTEYFRDLAAKPWLDEALALRLTDIENRWELSEDSRSLVAVRERAQLTAEVIDIIAEYEQTTGTMRALDLLKLEEIVPLVARTRALRDLLHEKDTGDDAASRSWVEKKIQQALEIAKANAGQDIPTLMSAAKGLGIAKEYEAELRRIIELTGTSASLMEGP